MFFSKISRSFTKLFFTFSSDIVAQLIFRFDFCSGHGKQILPFVIDALQKKRKKKGRRNTHKSRQAYHSVKNGDKKISTSFKDRSCIAEATNLVDVHNEYSSKSDLTASNIRTYIHFSKEYIITNCCSLLLNKKIIRILIFFCSLMQVLFLCHCTIEETKCQTWKKWWRIFCS